jgi:hypothetical protein
MAATPKKLQWLAISRDATGTFSAASNATIKRGLYLSAKTSKSSLPHTAIEAERICTTDALGQFWPKTLLLIQTRAFVI